jgi:GH25 family lysozyme M1 (1,4-beta-N-acetylmuramidase)
MNVRGVDLGYYQPKVNFEKLKDLGYKFVILRAGYGSALKYPNQYDPTFEDHYRNARAAGLDIGAYWYSYADSIDAAKDEAKAFIKALEGKLFEYPVYMDLEERSQFYRGKAFCDSIINAFCSELENAGYFAGVYCPVYWYTNFVSESVRNRYACWIAEYAPKCSYTGQYGIWQSGLVTSRHIRRIGPNFCHIDYPSLIKASGRNGFPKPNT